MEFKTIFEQVRSSIEDGVSWYDVGNLLGTLTRELVSAAEELNAAGSTKKTVVMGWVREAVALIVPAIPLPLWLRPFGGLIRSLATSILLAIADGLVEAAVSAL